jgi:hypothetical protein
MPAAQLPTDQGVLCRAKAQYQKSLGACWLLAAKRQKASPLVGMSARVPASRGRVGAMPTCLIAAGWGKDGRGGVGEQ